MMEQILCEKMKIEARSLPSFVIFASIGHVGITLHYGLK
jgi:hypothetical protein